MNLTTICRLGGLAGVLLILAAGTASGVCPSSIGTDCSGGTAWFGLRWDGANVAHGQSFSLSCESLLMSVEIPVFNAGAPNVGVPPMVQGDLIHCVIVDPGWTIHATATYENPYNFGHYSMSFDFSQLNVKLPPGNYVLLAYTNVPRWTSVEFCTADYYPGGVRYVSLAGLAGPWTSSPNLDTTFRVTVADVPTAIAPPTWGAIKALYR